MSNANDFETRTESGMLAWRPSLDDEQLVIDQGVLYGCYSREEYIVLPEGIKEIYYDAFDDCKRLVEITLPSTLIGFIKDEWGRRDPFDKNENLKRVNIPNSLMVSAKSFPEEVQICLSDRENFFKTSNARSVDFVDNSMAMTDEDMAYAWLFQSGAKWKDLLKERMNNPTEVLRMFAEIYQKQEKLPEPKVKVIKEYLEFYADELNAATVCAVLEKICAALPTFKKKLDKEPFFKDFCAEKEQSVHPIEALADQCDAVPPEYREALAKVVKKGIPYADGSGISSRKAVIVFLEQYMEEWMRCSKVTVMEWSGGVHTEKRRDLMSVRSFKTPVNANEIAAALDKTALSAFLLSMLGGASYRHYLLPFACWATEEDASSAISDISRRKKGNAKDRYWAENMIAALYLSNTNAVVSFMEKDKSCNLEEYLRMRGITLQEYRDKISVPQWNVVKKA